MPLRNGGSFFGDAPEKGAAEADVLWDGRFCPHVIDLFAFPTGSVRGAVKVDLGRLPGLHKRLMTPDGRHHVLIKVNGRSVQLCLSGAAISRSVHLLADAVFPPDRLRPGLRVLEEFNDLLRGRTTTTRRAAQGARDHRLYQVLRALDGRHAGASYRDIAVVLFGAVRVRQDWNDGSEHLKNHVRRLVKRGEVLVDGGYRQLLRQGF